jgi:hypothetical protein
MTAETVRVAAANGKRTRSARAPWLVPIGLIVLSLIPVVAGAMRLTELAGGAVVTEQNARFFGSPIPVVTHVVSVTVFCLVGAFQFVPSLRRGTRGKRAWHQMAGLILIPAGLLAALSGLWMSVFYPPQPGDSALLLVFRLVFGSAMAASIVLAVRAILWRDFMRHNAWMTRAYAIGVAAGTQALVLIPGTVIFGQADKLSRALLMGAAWVINLAVAEYVIHRRARHGGRRSRPSPQLRAAGQ